MNVIEVKNFKKYFGETKAVDDISFTVEKGEIFGYLGPNGAGKTTTIRCMMDFVRASEGTISILGKDSFVDSVSLKERVGYLSGNVRLYENWTGHEHIDFVRKLNGKKDIAVNLTSMLDFNPKIKTKKLSTGNRQKLGVIMAFMLEPEVLILDEPTTTLDPLLQNVVYDLLREATSNGTTVFMSSHNLAEVERVCSRVGIIRAGKMVAIESVKSLKEKRMYSVSVYFHEPVDKSAFVSGGVSVVKEMPLGLVMRVAGDINAVLKKLAAYNVKDISISQVSLEEIFLEYYE